MWSIFPCSSWCYSLHLHLQWMGFFFQFEFYVLHYPRRTVFCHRIFRWCSTNIAQCTAEATRIFNVTNFLFSDDVDVDAFYDFLAVAFYVEKKFCGRRQIKRLEIFYIASRIAVLSPIFLSLLQVSFVSLFIMKAFSIRQFGQINYLQSTWHQNSRLETRCVFVFDLVLRWQIAMFCSRAQRQYRR